MQLTGWDAVLLAVVLGAHGNLCWRPVRSTTRPGRLRRTATVVTCTLALLAVASVVVPFPPAPLLPLQWAGVGWLGVSAS